jgi:micrococcal nuclease
MVEKVIDGDTIVLKNGERVRYLGIDAPETRFSPFGAEYYGEEAKKRNRELVEGRRVRLEFDVEKRDKYGRLLAYVFVDSIFVNALLLREGYAKLHFIPPNNRYLDLFIKLEKEAKLTNQGLWRRK